MPIKNAIQSNYVIKLPVFEGPLDLLLHLIKEHRLDIYDIPIVEVTDQYLQILSLMESLDLEIAGEFFVVAASLLEIKSKMLLPPIPKSGDENEEIDPRNELVQKLLEYERFKKASEHLMALDELRHMMFQRSSGLDEYDPPILRMELSPMDLLFALQRMLSESGTTVQVTSIERQKVSLRMKIREVWNKIKEAGELGITFNALFDLDDKGSMNIVMSFLSVLELLKLGKIQVRQDKPLGSIMIWAIADG